MTSRVGEALAEHSGASPEPPVSGGSNRGTFALNTARAAHRIKDREDLAGVVGDPQSRRSPTDTAHERRERGITRGQSTGKTERKGAGGDVSGDGGRTGSRGVR